MSFWNSRQVKKTKKEHRCIYCRCKIEVGSSCWHETGTHDGDFNDYRLCKRCRHLFTNYRNDFCPDSEIGEFFEDISNCGILKCPNCHRDSCGEWEISHNKQSIEIECDDCDHHYTADLSIEGIDKFMRSGKNE